MSAPLAAQKHVFITARRGLLAPETIRDTVAAATPAELEKYLNAE